MVRLHRWLAIGVGLMLPVWFMTGTVLSFEPFPSLAPAARLAAAEPLAGPGRDSGAAFGSACLGQLAAAERLRLVVVDGALRWIGRVADGDLGCDAASGRTAAPVDAAAAARIAGQFAGRAVRDVAGPLEYDAWTVHDRYRAARPYWRVHLDDPAGTALYVSRRSGEVVQRTTARQRAWNAVGARLHWLNLGTLRASFATWHALMRGVATLGLLLVCAGLWLGLRRAWQWRRARRRGVSPFRGLLRLHHVAGLVGGFVVLAWLGSGWLSLDSGAIFGSATPTAAQVATLRGTTLAGAADRFRGIAAGSLAGAREAEIVVLAGQPRLVLRDGAGPPRVLAATRAGTIAPAAPVPDAELAAAVAAAWAPHRVVGIEPVAADDPWALRDAAFPPATRRLRLDDRDGTWVHLDAASAELVGVMGSGQRWRRWLVDGIHRLDFPALNRAGAWHPLLLLAMAGGLAFSATGVVLGLRRLSGSLRRRAWRAGSAASGTAS